MPPLLSRRALRYSLAALLLLVLLLMRSGFSIVMPGRSFRGPLAPAGAPVLSLADELRFHVEALANDTPQRNQYNPEHYARARDFVLNALAVAGLAPQLEEYTFDLAPWRDLPAIPGARAANVYADLPGSTTPGEVVIVGAHYDAVYGSPSANDNASGVACTLALARRLKDQPHSRTIRLILFANEEFPFFGTDGWGSLVHAKACRARGETVVAMLSLETLGYYSDAQGSQQYPQPLDLAYPSQGNFVAFVGLSDSESLVKRCVRVFRESCDFPSEGASLPSMIPKVAASDHYAFSLQGYPALMVTDTAPFRYPHYHKPTDTPDKLHFERLARVVEGLHHVITDLADN